MNEKMGRPALGDKPLTNAEKKRRYNAKASIKVKIAENYGFIPATPLVSKMHLLAMTEAFCFKLDTDALSIFIFKALKMYLETLDIKTIKSKHWPSTHDDLSIIKVESMIKFLEWEEQQ